MELHNFESEAARVVERVAGIESRVKAVRGMAIGHGHDEAGGVEGSARIPVCLADRMTDFFNDLKRHLDEIESDVSAMAQSLYPEENQIGRKQGVDTRPGACNYGVVISG